MNSDYDAIVIGSGAGGLTASLALARAGQKVLVLEQHYLPGGWTHTFESEGYSFSPGVHYIGDLGPGGRLRRVYEGLGVANDLSFFEIDPDGFDRIRIGDDFQFSIPKGRERFAERLGERFPADRDGIRKFLEIMESLVKGPPAANPTNVEKIASFSELIRFGIRPIKRTVEKFIKDPYCRSILLAQAGDHGMPPSRCPGLMHAATMAHYFEGGFYPRGGGRAIPRAFIKALRARGGEIRISSRVMKILIEKGSAIGVVLEDGTEIRAKRIVSNADPHSTYGLVPPEALPPRVRSRLARTRYSLSAISLFLAAEIDPHAAGLNSGNLWYLQEPDVEKVFEYASDVDPLARGDIPLLFLSCTTCKDPSKRRDGVSTFEAFAFISNNSFSKFAGQEGNARLSGYEAFKNALAERMMERIGRIVPGIRDRIRFMDIGTPLTKRFYLNATRGNLYGIEKSLFQFGPFSYPLRTPIDGLYMCGASTFGHGVAGATFSGLAVAGKILGEPIENFLTESDQRLRCEPCEADSSLIGVRQ